MESILLLHSQCCSVFTQVPPRRADNTPCKCKLRCYDKVSDAQRKALFEGFWKTSSFDVQNAYICGCIKVTEVRRRYSTSGNESRRSYTREYSVKKDGVVSVRVCKEAFLKIFGISNGRLDRALKAQAAAGGSPHGDQRGRHPPINKTTEAATEGVKTHINSFPCYKSHYSRKDNPNRNFLSPDLSIQVMYSLYKEKCQNENTQPVSEWVYRRIFNESFNLSFGK